MFDYDIYISREVWIFPRASISATVRGCAKSQGHLFFIVESMTRSIQSAYINIHT